MKQFTLLSLFALLLGASDLPLQGKETSPDERLRNATTSFRELMGAPDKGVPRDLFEKARCVVIIPGLKKGAFIVGGEYGRGFASCRKGGGGWTAPAAMRVEGGSWGLQIGGSSTDVLMLVMNDGGMKHLLGDKFKIGADATAAIGPVGRQASADTDIALHAEILSWSRSRGAFAGISLDGSTLRPDNAENERIYGKNVTNRDILMGNQKIPVAGRPLTVTLDRYSHEKVPSEVRSSKGASADSSPARLGTAVDKGTIYFDAGKSDLNADAQQNLNAVAQTLKDNATWKIHIVGYTDTSGNKASNLLLSKKRADAVKKYLIDQGVDGSRLSTTAGGEAGDGSNQRRVEIVRARADS